MNHTVFESIVPFLDIAEQWRIRRINALANEKVHCFWDMTLRYGDANTLYNGLMKDDDKLPFINGKYDLRVFATVIWESSGLNIDRCEVTGLYQIPYGILMMLETNQEFKNRCLQALNDLERDLIAVYNALMQQTLYL